MLNSFKIKIKLWFQWIFRSEKLVELWKKIKTKKKYFYTEKIYILIKFVVFFPHDVIPAKTALVIRFTSPKRNVVNR